jgi:aspartyl-tRNA(Asn)/glutamyl-tRNA(Gln) amidotransferase subunit A
LLDRPPRAAEAVERAIALADRPEARSVFTERFDDEARAEAAELDRRRAWGALTGLPLTVKDNIDVAGRLTRAGTPALDHRPPAERDADIVTRLRAAGAIILGHTTMTELAYSGLGANPSFGTPLNPAFPGEARAPGGSSAGAAVSVALGIAPFAIGTDTGGSVRIPAALCGVTGFKPTAAAVSRQGVIAMVESFDTVGPIAWTVEGCARVFAAIRQTPALAADDRPVAALRLGALTEDFVLSHLDDAVAAAYEKALRRLADAGATVVDFHLPEIDRIGEVNRDGSFFEAEAHPHLLALTATTRHRLDPRVASRIEGGRHVDEAGYRRLLEGRAGLIDSARARLQGFDAILMPTTAIVAPRLAELEDIDAYLRLNALLVRNPAIVNFLDGCAISLPCHERGAPPVGLTLFRMGGDDDALLAAATAVEACLRSGGSGDMMPA